MVKNRIHAVLTKNGVKHEFTDLFGVGGRNYLREIDLPKLQRIALDVLLRQLESVDNEVEFVQKQIAGIAIFLLRFHPKLIAFLGFKHL